LFGRKGHGRAHRVSSATNGSDSQTQSAKDFESIPLSELPVGTVRAVSSGVCVARLSEEEVVALSRRCPHQGGDLATGFVEDGKIVCPWHNIPFDARTGESPCKSLHSLRQFACELRGDQVVVSKDKLAGDTSSHRDMHAPGASV
jgi:nitrite reductase/ring-hydroxylating ferredoxin subunit